MSIPAQSFRRSLQRLQPNLAVLSAIAAGLAALYCVAVQNYFALDDFFWLYDGRIVLGSAHGWVQAFWSNTGLAYRPLSQNVFFWFGWHLFGFNPLGYHLLCLLALAITGMTGFLLFRRLLGGPYPALVAAAIFSFSSVNYQNISWVSAFCATGAAVAFMLSFYAFACRRKWLCAALYIVALLCDESATPLPLIALAVAMLMESDDLRMALRRTALLWIAFILYALFRVFVTGVAVASAGPYAVHLNLALYSSLALTSLANCLGWVPPMFNAMRGATGWSLLAMGCGVLFVLCVIVAIVFSIRQRSGAVALRGVIAGIVWFGVALSPLLLFTTANWSYHNLEIPLMGVALAIGSLFNMRPSRLLVATAVIAALAFFAANLGAVYAPGGWNEVDGENALGRAAAPLYGELASEAANACHFPIEVNIAGPDIATGSHVAGHGYGVMAMTGSTSDINIVYSDRPVANPVDTRIVWHPATFQFTLTQTDVGTKSACPR